MSDVPRARENTGMGWDKPDRTSLSWQDSRARAERLRVMPERTRYTPTPSGQWRVARWSAVTMHEADGKTRRCLEAMGAPKKLSAAVGECNFFALYNGRAIKESRTVVKWDLRFL